MLNKKQLIEHFSDYIFETINENFEKNEVITKKDLRPVFNTIKDYINLPQNAKLKDLIIFLVDEDILKPIDLRDTTKYLYGKPQRYKTALSIRKESYLSHYTALFLHDLTENVPKNIYTNKEQSKKRQNKRNVSLKQENIDKAFSKPARTTNHIVEFDEFKVYLLEGKNTDNRGVIKKEIDSGEILVTNKERTLIDVTVRPHYGGGVAEVLRAYKRAKNNISSNKLLAYLKQMNYIYPYHQAIGFYMERAGYRESVLKIIEKQSMDNKFYLTYNMQEKDFSKRWQLYYPQGF